jgi:platelet-activating factor acetylhydrolase isoform II
VHLDARDAMTVDSYDYDANCPHWPEVVGQFPVGTLEFEVIDPLRSSQYAPDPTVTRRLYVRAWYPAGDVAGYSRRPYFTEAEVGVVPVTSLQLLRQPPDALRNAVRLLTNAWDEAPPATGKFPVAVFNHGYLSYPAQHTALFEYLAATGYVVLSVGHPWESGGIVYPNGDPVLGSPRILEDMMQIGQALGAMAAYAAPTLRAQLGALREYIRVLRTTSAGRLAPVWRDDVYFVLDRLEENAIPAAIAVSSIIDHERRAYMGKSFGAYIAGMLAQGDPRARGVVHLDGGVWSYELVDSELRTPFLILSSDLWDDFRRMPELPPGMDPSVRQPVGPQTPTGSDLAYEFFTRAGLRPDGYRFLIPGIRHSGISDLPELAGVPALRRKLGTEAALTTFTGIQKDLVGGFLDRHVKSAPSDFPARAIATHPELIVQDLSWLRDRAQSELHSNSFAKLRERAEGTVGKSRS